MAGLKIPGHYFLMNRKTTIQRIKREFQDFSVNQKIIGSWILDHSDQVPFLTVKMVSNYCMVSTASVVRFCQRLGFHGFPELKDELFKENHERKEFSLFRNDSKDLIHDVPSHDIETIQKTFKKINTTTFSSVVELINSADTVFVAGLGISFLVGQILTYQLNQIGIRSIQMSMNTMNFNEQLINLQNKDCIIAFSFQPYSEETIEVVRQAKALGIKTVSISDREAAPVTFHSDYSLLAESENLLYINSLTGIVSLINTLITACTARNKKRAEAVVVFQTKALKERSKK